MNKICKRHYKKIIVLLIIVFSLTILPVMNIKAAGVNLSTNYIEIPVSGTSNIVISPSDVNGRIDVSCSGPIAIRVNNSDSNKVWLENGTAVISVTGTGVGTGTVTFNLADVSSTYSSPTRISNTLSVTVSVYQPQENAGAGTGGGEAEFAAPGEGSDDTSLAKLEVEGYEIKDEGNDIFSCTVPSGVEKVKVIAKANDDNAKVTGDGEYYLKSGLNEIEIVVEAENGFSRSYRLNITSKNIIYTLDELKKEIANIKEDTIIVKLSDGDKLDKGLLDAIKKAKKIVRLCKYDKNNQDEKLIFVWTLIGKNIKDMDSFDPAVSFESKNISKINELMNNAEGMILNFAYSGKLPKGTTFELNVSNNYKNGDTLFLYYFDSEKEKMSIEVEKIKVKNDMVSFELTHCSEFFLTQEAPIEENAKSSKIPYPLIILFAAIIILVGGGIFLAIFLTKKKKKQTKKTASNPEVIDIIEDVPMEKIDEEVVEESEADIEIEEVGVDDYIKDGTTKTNEPTTK